MSMIKSSCVATVYILWKGTINTAMYKKGGKCYDEENNFKTGIVGGNCCNDLPCGKSGKCRTIIGIR